MFTLPRDTDAKIEKGAGPRHTLLTSGVPFSPGGGASEGQSMFLK